MRRPPSPPTFRWAAVATQREVGGEGLVRHFFTGVRFRSTPAYTLAESVSKVWNNGRSVKAYNEVKA